MLLLLFTLGSAKGLERGPRKPEPNMPPISMARRV